MKPVMFLLLIVSLILLSCEGDKTVTPPEPPPGPPPKNMVTFQGNAFLDGQPDPVNALHLPLNWDIEVISYLPADTTSFDTVYTDSSGVYTSTKLRQDGMYDLVARYPYYRLDTVQVEVREGQVVGSIPELHCQRLIRYSIHPDSLVYHSLHSTMILDEYVVNLSSEYNVAGSFSLKELLVREDSLSLYLFAGDPGSVNCGMPLKPGKTYHNRRARFLGSFSYFSGTILPTTGSYFLYAMPARWPECAFIFVSGALDDGITNHHYQGKRHWMFKLIEPTRVDIKLE